MSRYLTNAAVIQFDNEVKHEYQATATLRRTATVRSGVVGASYKFTRMGKGTAQQKATQADVTPMDIAHSRQTATLENWYAAEYTDIFDAAEVNFDERQELAKIIANGLGRAEDQLIIDAADAVTYSATKFTAVDTGWTYDYSATGNFGEVMLAAMREYYQQLEIEEDVCIVCPPSAMQALLKEPEPGSSDYNTVKALIEGKLEKYYGFYFYLIGERAEGGLPGATNDSELFAFPKSAMGLAIGMDIKTTVDWVPEKLSWLACGTYKAGAIAREGQGFIKAIYNEAA